MTLRTAAVAAVAVALVLGLLDAHRLTEPGRSERDGIRLAAEAGAHTAADADWTYAPAKTRVRRDTGSFTIEPRQRGLQLISRPLALVEGRCYEARIQLATRGNVALILLSEYADEKLQEYKVEPSTMPRTAHVRFDAVSSRLTLGVVAKERSARATVGASTISPRPC
jgi:hypothetical protein